VSWWVISTLIGFLSLPICWRFFGKLGDRGYGFTRVVGLLIAGYVLWMGASLGFLRNGFGGVIGSVLVLAIVGGLVGFGHWRHIIRWMRTHWKTLLMMEALFLLVFLGWTFVRANNPEIEFTEKPMELAFINGILQSERFPPVDPWLSGYAISYYYFGYVLMTVFIWLSGVSSAVAFNLGNALWFGLCTVAAYSILYNLLVAGKYQRARTLALLAPVFVLIAGNLAGFLDVLWSRHLFWSLQPDGTLNSAFWRWLDLKQLSESPTALIPGHTPTWMPDRFLWWWRASRVVRDVNLAGIDIEVIDEFPFFTFLLADNHPHLLGLPIAFLAVGFSLRLFLKDHPTGFTIFGLPLSLDLKELVFAGWIFGALAFLNTWDSPIYLALLLLVLWWIGRKARLSSLVTRLLLTMVGIILLALLFYLPWYPSFSSQAGGILPNIVFPTKLQHFLVMFSISFIPIAVWLGVRLKRNWSSSDRKWLIRVGLILPLALFILSLFLGGLVLIRFTGDPATVESILADLGVIEGDIRTRLNTALGAAVNRRLLHSWTAIILGLTIGACAALIMRQERTEKASHSAEAADRESRQEVWPFVVFLVAVGALLILGPEFLYLKDLFGTRMNTVFKFYFAAWILWGLAGSFAVIELWPRQLSGLRILRVLIVLPLILGLVYPPLSVWTKTNGFNPAGGRTLDGTDYLSRERPQDYQAIQWIKQKLTFGTIAESVGGSYSVHARISGTSGFPTVLGWDFHEIQWRGNAEPQGTRAADIQMLYESTSIDEVNAILDAYDIKYVYIGPLERSTYQRLNEKVFDQIMELVYESPEVKIYARR
jgi:YYY domain-containing protein